jgi:hypothetical protein
MKDAEHHEVGGVQLDIVAAGNCHVKRSIYPVGFRWFEEHEAACRH